MSFPQFGESFRVWQTSGAQAGMPEITLPNDGTPWFDPCGKAALYRKGSTLYAVLKAREGDISLTAIWRGAFLNFDIWLPKEFARKTRGILGDFDGNPCNDFIDRSGLRIQHCNPNSIERTIFNHMLSCESTKHY